MLKKILNFIEELITKLLYQRTLNFERLNPTQTGLDNTFPYKLAPNADHMLSEVIEPLQQQFLGFYITSFYRSYEVNKRVGGTLNSAHLTAEAIDCCVLGGAPLVKLVTWINSNLDVDYIKVYPTYIHITKRRRIKK